jgi:hypothetical protein
MSIKLLINILFIVNLYGCGADNASEPSGSITPAVSTFCGNTDVEAAADISIAWDTPFEYSDDSPLDFSDIDGYRIYFGNESKRYNNIIRISDPAITSCSIPVESSDTYYISMTVVTKDGLESDYSNEIIRTI